MKRHLWTPLASALTICIGLPVCASGQTVVPPLQGTSNYVQNWNQLGDDTDALTVENGFTLPSAGNAIINGNRTIQVDSVINTIAGNVFINNSNNGVPDAPTGTLEINTGGSLSTGTVIVSVNDDAGTLAVQGGTLNAGGNGVEVRENGTVSITSGELNSTGIITAEAGSTFGISGGILNVNVTEGAALDLDGGNLDISGGTVTLTDPAPGGGAFVVTNANNTGAINVSGGEFRVEGLTAGSDTVSFGNDVINISGGTFDVSGGQVFAGNDTQFNIIGDAATIQLDRLNLATATRQSTFNFVFDSDGVSTVENDFFLALSEANLLVDGSAYEGGMGSFDLFTSGNLTAGFDLDNVTVTGLGVEGVDFTLVQATGSGEGNGNITLNVMTEDALKGDVDLSGAVNFLDIPPFITALTMGSNQPEADTNCDGIVNFLDISPFIGILAGG